MWVKSVISGAVFSLRLCLQRTEREVFGTWLHDQQLKTNYPEEMILRWSFGVTQVWILDQYSQWLVEVLLSKTLRLSKKKKKKCFTSCNHRTDSSHIHHEPSWFSVWAILKYGQSLPSSSSFMGLNNGHKMILSQRRIVCHHVTFVSF